MHMDMPADRRRRQPLHVLPPQIPDRGYSGPVQGLTVKPSIRPAASSSDRERLLIGKPCWKETA
jgi:hypothetical protein